MNNTLDNTEDFPKSDSCFKCYR